MSDIEPSALYSANALYVEGLYEQYLNDPKAVPEEWQAYFDQLRESEPRTGPERAHGPVVAAFERAARRRTMGQVAATPAEAAQHEKQVAVLQLINAYRFRGHRAADLDPLKQYERPNVPELDPAFHGLTEADMDIEFNTGSLAGPHVATLREILDIVHSTYCRTIGAEYMHINETSRKRWIQQRLESCRGEPGFNRTKRAEILERLVAANALESYLHNRYVGQKRFSLEGGESLIPLLDQLVQRSGEIGVREVVVGMAHRGRINALINIVGKCPSDLFQEFEGQRTSELGQGDVKYHLGYSSDLLTPGGPVHVTLGFNPSHLEIIDPVVEGSVRARQDRRRDTERAEVLPVLLHGDAAFAGQGVVMETFNLSETRGYSTGGTVHVVVNNQIGFTTSDPLDSRSTLYCTDVAKMVQAPIFHVNADDPEAVVLVMEAALDYRMAFKKDVVIDLICYRKHGHSEADEPSATQPVMYQKVREHPGVARLYGDNLVAAEVISDGEVDRMREQYEKTLDAGEAVSRPQVEITDKRLLIDWARYGQGKWTESVDTSITPERIAELTESITTVPEGFQTHKAVTRINAMRRQMGAGEVPMDWGYAENMAYASLLTEGYPVRLSGQDSGRGTFFHRHAVIHDQSSGETFLPLRNLGPEQSEFLVINSPLSEEAVLGFEYGYAASAPESLVIWEAQFGDFANGAQVVIDQFIASCEAKWGRLCGLVMLLPHGYDGQGPEHSSARLERFLQLCAEINMIVMVPSTPAQMFHMLRRQVLRRFRRPLVVMSPKSLLRNPLSVSTIDQLSEGGLQLTFDEIDPINAEDVDRLLLCSGKVYFDLLAARREHQVDNIAIARLEQVYPFPRDEVQDIILRYPNLREVVWVQEEPRNQGAWVYLLARRHLKGCLLQGQTLELVGRPYSASPAVGYHTVHLEQQRIIVEQALRLDTAASSQVSA